jgi:hypothetical protein
MGKHCEAVELLLARMDSNPEEFKDGGRWEGLIVKYRTYLSATDRLALEDKINALRLDTFHKAVMSELLAEPSEEAVVDPSFYQGIRPGAQVIGTTVPTAAVSPYINAYQNTLSNTGAGSALTNTSSNINLSEGSIKSIAAALGAYANVWRP